MSLWQSCRPQCKLAVIVSLSGGVNCGSEIQDALAKRDIHIFLITAVKIVNDVFRDLQSRCRFHLTTFFDFATMERQSI